MSSSLTRPCISDFPAPAPAPAPAPITSSPMSIGLQVTTCIWKNMIYNDSPLVLNGDDHLPDDWWFMNHVHITRDNQNQITGFELNGNRVMHLQFVKTK